MVKLTSPGPRAPQTHQPDLTLSSDSGRSKLQLLKLAGSNLVNSCNFWVSLSWCIHKHSSTGSLTTHSSRLLRLGSARTHGDTALKLIGPVSRRWFYFQRKPDSQFINVVRYKFNSKWSCKVANNGQNNFTKGALQRNNIQLTIQLCIQKVTMHKQATATDRGKRMIVTLTAPGSSNRGLRKTLSSPIKC